MNLFKPSNLLKAWMAYTVVASGMPSAKPKPQAPADFPEEFSICNDFPKGTEAMAYIQNRNGTRSYLTPTANCTTIPASACFQVEYDEKDCWLAMRNEVIDDRVAIVGLFKTGQAVGRIFNIDYAACSKQNKPFEFTVYPPKNYSCDYRTDKEFVRELPTIEEGDESQEEEVTSVRLNR